MMIEHAMKWHKQGITPIPCLYGTKQPLIKWSDWCKRKVDEREIIDNFNRLCNIAIYITNGLVVVDFDKPAPCLAWKARVSSAMLETFTVRSNRGWHFYYWCDDPPAETIAIDGGELLVNHLITVPPSRHESGNYYRVLNDSDFRQIGHVDDLLLPYVRKILPDRSPSEFPSLALSGKTFSGSSDGQTTVARIKNQIAILPFLLGLRSSTLKGMGNDSVMICCPFHDDKSPSMQVWPTTGRCKCYSPSCQACGRRAIDVIDCAAIWYRCDNQTAIQILSRSVL